MITKKRKKEKHFPENLIYTLLILILFFGAVAFLIISNIRINQKRAEMNERIDSLKKEIQVLEEKNQQLKAGLSQIQEESYWEEKIREQGYKKPGEEVAIILSSEGSEKSEQIEKNFWQKLLDPVRNFFGNLQ